MSQIMDPTEIAKGLRDTYLRYLETSFYLKDPALQKQFVHLLRDKAQPPLVREPILEIAPNFLFGDSLAALIGKGILSNDFMRLESNLLNRPLYKHQEVALQKSIKDQRNLVVATGTGSGKTECFLYPSINHLLLEKESGTLAEPGVRALLLYPMNALANDQIARLRQLAKEFPEITFGRYTGETEQSKDKALAAYRDYHDGEDPLPNELICRDEMQAQESRPHILFTNYAMLEYLLIRPKDSPLFDGGKWRFIVLDEVHSYSGALGVEVALLLRRLKDRVVESEKGRLQCIGTSATLGEGEKDYPKIAEFATNLFGEEFEPSDVIGASQQKLDYSHQAWGSGSRPLYSSLKKIVFSGQSADLSALMEAVRSSVPESTLLEAKIEAEKSADPIPQCQAFLYTILAGDAQVQKLRGKLEKQRALELPNLGDIEGLTDLVALGSFARQPGDANPLIPARYHIMARAIAGVFSSFDVAGKLNLLSRREKKHNGRVVFELGSCNRCGEVMLVGEKKLRNGQEYLEQPPGVGDDPIVPIIWLALKLESRHEVDEDDEISAVIEEENTEKKQKAAKIFPMRLCMACGRIADASTFDKGVCEDRAAETVDVYQIENKPHRSVPRQCPSCLNNHGTVASRVLTGKEVPVAVLATSLYQKIPKSPKSQHPGGGRKLMMFSDSRQDAAFFAPFMDNTYNKFKQRRYLVQALECSDQQLDLEGLVLKVRKMATEAGEWDDPDSPKCRRDAEGWVLREWIAIDRRLALEGAGAAIFRIRKPNNFSGFAGSSVLSGVPWNLNEGEQWALIQVLLDTIRYQGIVSFDGFSPEHTDKIFKPRNVACYLRGSSSNSGMRIYSWEPATEHHTNVSVKATA